MFFLSAYLHGGLNHEFLATPLRFCSLEVDGYVSLKNNLKTTKLSALTKIPFERVAK